MKAGRNDPCPCGSGKKHKRCCMISADAGETKLHQNLAAYAAPLVDGLPPDAGERLVDGALKTAAVCWKLALVGSDAERDAAIAVIVQHAAGSDEERQNRERMIRSMIARHREMFPEMHGP